MNWAAIGFDWNQVRAFLATVEEGSLSAAARALGHTQPTLSRQIAELERALGMTLFHRVGKRLVLTPGGTTLLDHARAMGTAASHISLIASGQAESIYGRVAISASDVVSSYILPVVLVELHRVAPGIEVELVSSNSVSDLLRREADIAIRHLRPTQPDLVARRIGVATAGLHASSRYLDAYGAPSSAAELAGHVFVGFEPVDRLIDTLATAGIAVERRQFQHVTNNGVAMGQMVSRGLGIGMFPTAFSALMPGIVPVLPEQVGLPVPFWLVTHQELRTSRRIRFVFDFLAEQLFPLERWA